MGAEDRMQQHQNCFSNIMSAVLFAMGRLSLERLFRIKIETTLFDIHLTLLAKNIGRLILTS